MNILEKNHEPKKISDAASKLTLYNWDEIAQALDRDGHAVLGGLFSADECSNTSVLYEEDRHFRSRVNMARHGFGKGEYRYFQYPLPSLIGRYREELYPYLAKIANVWNEKFGIDTVYPLSHKEFLQKCSLLGQTKPTPLLLKYGAGDYNCLHQDIYGDILFPIQAVVLLSAPGEEFVGGEFVIVEQRPRMQSRVEVVTLQKGDAVLLAVHSRPIDGVRGAVRVNLKHGVSRVRAGSRYTAGIIFHDAV